MKTQPSNPTLDNALDYQATIVNLSTINKLRSLSAVLDQFADLHYEYAQSWLHYKWYSKLWVSTKYITMTRTINDYKLGNIDTDTFISLLQNIFYFIPKDKNPRELLEKAWNSLIDWDEQSTQRLNFLINKNQLICLISNTNELNIQKIKQDINSATGKAWDWQEQTLDECKFQVAENFRLMTSYENKVFKTDGLVEKLVTELQREGKTLKEIILVSQYKPDLDKAKELGIESMPADQFFPMIPALQPTSASQIPLNNTVYVTSPTTTPVVPVPSNILASSQLNFFGRIPKNEENPSTTTSEKTPLLQP